MVPRPMICSPFSASTFRIANMRSCLRRVEAPSTPSSSAMETSSAGVFFLRSFKCINVVPGKECCENCRSTLFWGKNSHARTAGKAASVTPRPIFSQRDLKEAVPSERLHYGENDDKREIGRASCRERVCQYVLIAVVAATLKKYKQDENNHNNSKE